MILEFIWLQCGISCMFCALFAVLGQFKNITLPEFFIPALYFWRRLKIRILPKIIIVSIISIALFMWIILTPILFSIELLIHTMIKRFYRRQQ